MAGRPKYKFTEEQIAKAEDLAFQGCQNGTIATEIGISRQLLDQRADILTLLTKKRAERKYALRAAQTTKAIITKDTAMLCFLGKNELGQEDKKTIRQEGGLTLDLSPELMALGKQMAKNYGKETK